MAKITVYMTGSVAVYKAVEVVRSLQKLNHEVRVVMSDSAQQFVGTATLASLLHTPVLTDIWQNVQAGQVPHIEWADWTELAVVVPASANVIAKMANGLADDTVSTTLLATAAPKLVVPAMNSHMWENPATQRNLQQLQADGVTVLEPATGLLAEGYTGKGRMPEPAVIVEAITTMLTPAKQETIVITAGGTREAIDPVRFIGNRSTGKMGMALANAALKAGYRVHLIVGQVEVAVPKSPHLIVERVETTRDMLTAVERAFTTATGLIMAAAVADYAPAEVATQKLKKQGDAGLTIQLQQNPDILATMGANKRADQWVVGFAAETNDLDTYATRKLMTKQADLIIGNDVTQVGAGFGTDTNIVTLYQNGQAPVRLAPATKAEVAAQIIQFIQQRF
ncbi:bifunctional phosphopantothenoylcysteine decarboxylase/phosphopantothenate--cysteine ligase CoaBC [Limosilactobacillus equigenerosi]|uniref:Coenzyme A biosynthesis bifunctional protein CoaBC n=1 Tax=Limosilactobacillus equigenerosi DSM 18793 = JCM 14505 TaxID=1423742 RepID=A0A0R1UKT2_9LACO|nr:bifunctional phosphopantothenoylcysteine decarboxylase/phosphopantothenate--cysteine ligase CoaBC [Limosilactobacillus equigenerosi]KRL93942.1 putative phosphopantothenate--cysteine ligase [Limosilactobacillus equigenerosi DSM 18793 = JCM 14505]